MIFRENNLLVQMQMGTEGSIAILSHTNEELDDVLKGEVTQPYTASVDGKPAILFSGGKHGSSYIQLPPNIMDNVTDDTGMSVTCWVYLNPASSVWERIIDFGAGPEGPYLFLTRNLRAVCFNGIDIAADFNKQLPLGEWIHIGLVLTGTQGGTASQAGPKLYVNGELAVNGEVSQTTSGTYLAYRQWFAEWDKKRFTHNYIGHSQFTADDDFNGAISNLKVFGRALHSDSIVQQMCESLDDEQVIRLASQTDLSFPSHIVTNSADLVTSLLSGRVQVTWTSSHPHVISHEGQFNYECIGATALSLTAELKCGVASYKTSFDLTALSPTLYPYEIKLDASGNKIDISQDLYGLFFEDINNAADGGIYAELVKNRSFENFTYENFSHVCGEHGHSSGKIKHPLDGWYGDLDLVEVKETEGINTFLNIQDPDSNATYIHVKEGAVLVNKGFNDTNHGCAMNIEQGKRYLFTVWAKATSQSSMVLVLMDEQMSPISDSLKIFLTDDGQWHKYGVDSSLVLTAHTSGLGQLSLTVKGEVSLDMVSLFPEDVWGKTEELDSTTAHLNYQRNRNYRLRKDMVVALQRMKPRFLRFPGGCITEGSHVWDNVYDWKHSVGHIEYRKENFNVWGYMMTLGLGYMEYFQLAEDLNATPLPVMACGVLCQARSDYANPAGGALRDYYIKNFTDLIDFALSVDFDGNEWAKLRDVMGHREPFDLRYLGVGNENWGTEFFANFEYFKAAIDEHMRVNYPSQKLTIISTVGAQADDQAYQQGWKFLSGRYEGSEVIAFTDGERRIEEHISWYAKQSDYMDTIADEHYYRSNDYLLKNADRYNYYYRAYDEQGNLDEAQTSKVFVGEYASNDKNTLAGAIAEAVIMTGFENNADVVRLAAYAPLFNKVLTDGQYRWTPDCIWFDDTAIWYTPNYYVQKLFGQHLGKQTIASDFYTYRDGEAKRLRAEGGLSLSTLKGEVLLQSVVVRDLVTRNIVFEQNFTEELSERWHNLNENKRYDWQSGKGVVLSGDGTARVGLYIEEEWSQIEVEVKAVHLNAEDGLYIGVGAHGLKHNKSSMIEYVVGEMGLATGIKVHKNGVQSYMLGDFASSTMAGNLRAAFSEKIACHETYIYTLQYGDCSEKILRVCHKKELESEVSFEQTYRLEPYNNEVFYTASQDDTHIYVKMVNAEATDKKLKIDFEQFNVERSYELHVLTGDETLLHVANVNTKEKELVAPYTEQHELVGQKAELRLPAYSVTVGVWKQC